MENKKSAITKTTEHSLQISSSSIVDRGLGLSDELTIFTNPFDYIKEKYRLSVPDEIGRMGFSPSGKYLVAVTRNKLFMRNGKWDIKWDAKIYIWDMDTGSQLAVFPTKFTTQGFDFFASETKLISSNGATISVWDLDRLELIQSKYHEAALLSDYYNGPIEVSRETEDEIPFGPVADFQGIKVFESHNEILALEPLHYARVFDLSSLEELRMYEGEFEAVYEHVRFSESGRMAISSGVVGQLSLWKYEPTVSMKCVQLDDYIIEDPVAISGDGKTCAATWFKKPIIYFIDTKELSIKHQVIFRNEYKHHSLAKYDNAPISNKAVTANYNYGQENSLVHLISGGNDGNVLRSPEDFSITGIDLSKDGSISIAGTEQGDLILIDLRRTPKVYNYRVGKKIYDTKLCSRRKLIAAAVDTQEIAREVIVLSY